MDGMTYQPALPGLPMPPPSPVFRNERVMLRAAALQLKHALGARRLMEAAALAECIAQIAAAYDGESAVDAALRVNDAREALDEAEAMRRIDG